MELLTMEAQSEIQHDALFKVIIIGDTGVGKSCMLGRLIQKEFKEEYTVTIGVEFGNYVMRVDDKKNVKLQLWDTAGQEHFRAITRIFYKDSHAVILVYDITQRESFENIQTWMNEIEQNTNKKVIRYLVGNMCDLESEREVSSEEALKFAKDNGLNHFIETSAKSGTNIDNLFETVTKQLYFENKDNLDEFGDDPDN